MIMYHGTASTYLPSIQKNGLRASLRRAFNVVNINGDKPPVLKGAVYLTTSRETAENFAILRASYLTSAPGHRVEFPPARFYKDPFGPAPIADAKPIVLEVEVTPDIYNKLNDDEQALSMEAFWYPGIIPPSAIVKVDTL